MDSEADLKDAGAICGVFAALETANAPRSSQANSARRWVMNGLWATTRCYDPETMLWSATAREAYTQDPQAKLIREHVVPINLIREELLRGPQTAEAYAETLTLMMLVVTVTPDEDKRLSRKGHPDPTDPWARYRAAGIDVDGFATLAPLTPKAQLPAALSPAVVDALTIEPYSNYECPRCGSRPGEPCRTKDNRSTQKPHNHRRLGGFPGGGGSSVVGSGSGAPGAETHDRHTGDTPRGA